MKRILTLFSMAVWTLLFLVVSCDRHRHVIRGFVDEPQDSILIDLSGYIGQGPGTELVEVRKYDGYYYFLFFNGYLSDLDGPHFVLMAASEDKLRAKHIPFPEGVDGSFSFFERNDTFVMEMDDDRFYSFNPKKWKWSPITSGGKDEETLYEDDDWKVKFVSNDEFEEVTWFIDKHSQDEYAFIGLNGGIRRLSDAFYVVTRTRIYKIPDPSIGFQCDSSTRFENAKDIKSLIPHFVESGYTSFSKYFVNPVVCFDNEDLSGEITRPDGTRSYHNPYKVFGENEMNGRIVASFCASDTLFCVLNTSPGLELARLDDSQLVPVHHFNKDIGYCHPVVFPYGFPSLTTRYKYRDKSNLAADDRMLLQINTEEGGAEVIDLAHNGNTVLKIRYLPYHTPVE